MAYQMYLRAYLQTKPTRRHDFCVVSQKQDVSTYVPTHLLVNQSNQTELDSFLFFAISASHWTMANLVLVYSVSVLVSVPVSVSVPVFAKYDNSTHSYGINMKQYGSVLPLVGHKVILWI